MSDTGHWICENFQSESFGFIYLITNLKNNRKYIGKKQLQFKKKRKLKSRKNSKITFSESDWKTYTGSCRELNEDIEKFGKENFRFEILMFCKSKWELAYEEIKLQIQNEVIKNSEYYNGIINVRIGKPKEYWFKDGEKR
jgi:hypothetical protein